MRRITLLTLWVRDDASRELTGPHMGQGTACTWNSPASSADTFETFTFTFTFHLAHPPDKKWYRIITFQFYTKVMDKLLKPYLFLECQPSAVTLSLFHPNICLGIPRYISLAHFLINISPKYSTLKILTKVELFCFWKLWKCNLKYLFICLQSWWS